MAHLAPPHRLPALIRDSATELGAHDAVAYLADLQQTHLIPFRREALDGADESAWLPVDTTLPGRAFQHITVLSQAGEAPDTVRLWVPLVDGAERVGVLAVTVDAAHGERVTAGSPGVSGDGDAREVIERFAALVAEVVMTKTMYGDEIVRLRRRYEMDLAAELQWSLLPPLTFACSDVAIAGALEPAYEVAGDTLDYAVDEGILRAAVFDGMGHSLRSGQLSALAVAAYRNARRTGRSLTETGAAIDEALLDGFAGNSFATAILAELDTDTGVLSWVSAGHPAPLLLRNHHLVKELACPPRPPLGMALPKIQQAARTFTVGTETLQPGDRVLLYTDGVTEAHSPDGELFGEERLIDLLRRNFAAQLPSAETLRRVVRALLEHQQGRLSDDASLLIIEWRPPAVDRSAPDTATTPS
jgi:hypothetical protein